MRRLTPLRLFALLCAGCSGPGSGPAPAAGTYSLSLTGYTSVAGRRMELKLKDADGQTTVASYSGSIRPDGTRQIRLDGVLVEGRRYRVDWYVDFDGDGAYTPPRGPDFIDPSWRRTITGALPGVEEGHTFDRSWTDISPF